MRYALPIVFAAALVSGTCAALPLPFASYAIVYAGAATVLWRTGVPRGWRTLLAVVAVSVAAIGAVRASAAYTLLGNLHEQRMAAYDSTVIQSEARENGFVTLLRLPGGMRAECFTDRAFVPGVEIQVRGRLSPFDRPRNPGEEDQRVGARARGADARLDACAVERYAGSAASDLETVRANWRRRARAVLEAQTGEPAATILAGELWGERGALSPALRGEFQETGTIHVLVTAGLHVGLIAALATWAFSRMRVHRAAGCVMAAICVAAFVWFSGAHLPAVRAGTMAVFALAARACGRRAMSWNALACAAIVIVFLDPLQVLDASFWLSFCCVAAIFSVAPAAGSVLERFETIPHQAREALLLTVATQLGTWPLTASVFLKFAPYAVVANLAIVPIVPMMMCAGLAQIALSLTPLAGAAIIPAHAAAWCVDWITGILDILDRLPFANVAIAAPPLWSVVGYETALVLCPLLLRWGAGTCAIAALVCAAAWCVVPPQWPDGRLRIVVLDVGQADAILVVTPGRHALLVDAGGRLERGAQGRTDAERIGERVVVPALLHEGVTHLDFCLLSHPHGDHAGGFPPVLRALGCDEITDTRQRYTGHAYIEMLAIARTMRTRILDPPAGTTVTTGDGVTLHVLGPPQRRIRGSQNDINNNSLVFMLQYGSFRMLFTGDAGTEAERRILERSDDLHATVLKVGHHGSAYGSSAGFLDAVRPRAAVISVGRHNLFGHPAPQTIDALRARGIAVYRTDRDGAIGITTDGRSWNIATCLAGCAF